MNKTKRIEADGSADENILAMYINEIIKIPLMTREEEDITARLAAGGDKAALDKLVSANLRFVVNVAKRYQGQGLPLSDLISEGNIGLMNAVERFDVTKGYHFISYAVWWIRQAILKAICEKSRMIRLPMNRAGELVRIERARKEIHQFTSSENEIREIATMLNMNETLVSDLISISRDMISLDTPVFDDSEASLGDHIQDEVFQSPYEFAEQSVMHDDIESVLNTLDKKEADIIRCRYGIGLGAGMTLREVGDRFNLTKERIRQIEMKALKRLQHPKRMKILQSYVA
ncbi:MAG: RNA polymerase sigma factor RpoD/SigA [Spirochaetaceae bacterium]|nr:RNA polymerase sigma factor RpoD/SigA [Spirochaetaceae bacterium]